ncbi:MAG: mechanosensitive ion channel domain-containing protein, partial [Candidatus Acidiferrum sp.]
APATESQGRGTRLPSQVPADFAVDQSSLSAAQRLAALVTSADEEPYALEAIRIADHAVDLQFAQALKNAEQHPPVLSAEAKEIQGKLAAAQQALDADNAQVKTLSDADAKASGAKKDTLDDELALAKAQQESDGNEVDDAKQDLVRAGGDPHARIQEMAKAHETAEGKPANFTAVANNLLEERGLIHRLTQWRMLRAEEQQLAEAKADAERHIERLSTEHSALEARLQAEKNGPPATASLGAAADAPYAASASAPALNNLTPKAAKIAPGRGATHSHDEAVSLLKNTRRRAVDQQALATFDRRIDDQKDLASVYGNWQLLVAAKKREAGHKGLLGLSIILAILLLGLVFDGWLEKLLGKTALDRRQVQTLRTLTRVTLQILAVLFILLVIFGRPSQLGTFLGLAGAGLTVALKDFIVGFLGWFVLMGKNGIRLGDWVEINGVTGEVVELGMFHTVLLETGNWTDSGHPTGRRVTFTNSFAIENHYFNFSTSGQWLWDELQVVLPVGMDPYPIVAAIQKKVIESTSASSQKAESEWKQAAGDRNMTLMTAAPAINVKPVVGGVEVSVRYITSANERHLLRAKLYQEAVDLLGKAGAAADVEKKAGAAQLPSNQA